MAIGHRNASLANRIAVGLSVTVALTQEAHGKTIGLAMRWITSVVIANAGRHQRSWVEPMCVVMHNVLSTVLDPLGPNRTASGITTSPDLPVQEVWGGQQLVLDVTTLTWTIIHMAMPVWHTQPVQHPLCPTRLLRLSNLRPLGIG